MKKFFKLMVIVFITIFTSSCTENYIARTYGGTVKVEVEPGYKVTSATWKETDLFYFIEPMEDDYTPKTKKFIESSSLGILESEVIFYESKR